mmetsp:Transcript_27670/g.38473  ORF Transcript_27670/g.38473 Transcript_27670/m.38473 type:complete len:386 (+) Transcript_27670:168-1325(+)|eukprot:CAMPEP_0184484662 /NCGR_PEP_ID=MMETSP0113_2-20130426/6353_1 /TAXON_ID=91329 /ORGANISM="Norrisiella sphaerica, Strain BC52" /LENGTH=385 /DNA_ID=CAMNT_0026865749 /DNA_START=205 /DNA_END=1362 /DNA_ORIENTATION=-
MTSEAKSASAEEKHSSEEYVPVVVKDAKTQMRVLYIRHGESVSNFFKSMTKDKTLGPKDLIDQTLKEMKKMRHILPEKDVTVIENIKRDGTLGETIKDMEDNLLDVVLSEKGIRDAKRLSRKLFGHLDIDDNFRIFSGPYPVSHVIVSPLRRTMETFLAVFGRKLTKQRPKGLRVEVNPYFHEWVKRDTASSRCHSVEVTRAFPGLYSKHHHRLLSSEESREGATLLSSWFRNCCSGRRDLRDADGYKGQWFKSMERSIEEELKSGWSDKGSKLAEEFGYASGAETFITFHDKQLVQIKKRLSELVDARGAGGSYNENQATLIVAHGMVAKCLFKDFLGDFDMQNFAIIEALWDKKESKFVECRFLQNSEGTLPAWGKKKVRKLN